MTTNDGLPEPSSAAGARQAADSAGPVANPGPSASAGIFASAGPATNSGGSTNAGLTANHALTATAAGRMADLGTGRDPLSARLALRAIISALRQLSHDVLVVSLAALALLAGLTVTVLTTLDVPAARPISVMIPGLIALAGGVLLAWTGGRGPELARYCWLMSAALILWAIGQIADGIDAISVPGFPAIGDVISILGAPLALAAVLSVPWRARMPHPGRRLGLDAGLIGVSLALPLWHFGFAGMFHPGSREGTELAAAAILVADVTLVCVGGLAFLRDFDRHVLIAWAGITCYTIGDLINLGFTLQHPGHWTAFGAVLWSIAWPLIVAGLLRYEPPPVGAESGAWPLDLDARGIMITTTVSLALMVLTVASLMIGGGVDRISLGLVIVAAVVFWARELLNSRFRAQLLHELHAEATADPLTGLANRRVLAGRMAALRHGDSWCLLTVDLDGFKDVNDLLGHGTGDRLLAAVANRLREASPPDALVSRIGGDEFAILLPGDIEVGARVGAAIVTAVRQSAADVEGVARVEVSASVGVAAVHGDGARAGLITLPPSEPLPPGSPFDGSSRPAAPAARPAGNVHDGVSGVPPRLPRRSPGNTISRLGAEPAPPPDPLLPVDIELAAEPASTPDRGLGFGAGVDADRDPAAGSAHAAQSARSSGWPASPAPAPGLDTPEVVDPLSALSASSAALRVAKAAGRNRVEIYDAKVAQIRRRRLRVEERLRSAVETGAITVLYQPIVDLRRGVVAGCEALARWMDTELGRVDPGEFITVAEQTGLVVEIGERVLQETLRNAVAGGLFDRGLRVACNVSPVQLRVAGFHRVVQEAIASHGVPHEQLVIEVTEQVLVEEGQAAQTLHRLANLGLTIAIDDFGTGYSALGYLQRLPADILKIDRSLTSSLIAEPRSRAITRAVVDLGRTVGLSVVVEGVESGQVDDLVRKMGVGFGQGLYYGPAMTAPELAAMADRLTTSSAP